MQEFRDMGVDNKRDLLSYLDEEGYLDTRHQPNHALAILHVAENFELRDLYIDAFAHCVGMSEQLYKSPEYSATSNLAPRVLTSMAQRISVVSRKLIRLARVDLDNRLSRAGAMLGDLLETELSEAHLGLSTGARAHLDRFRNYIQGFYTTKLGHFPPPPAQGGHSTVFKPDLYNTLKADFEALYEYLVDERFTTAGNSPFEAQGGLCTLQSVQAFDSRNKFSPLEHPLPLLPETPRSKESRRMSMPWQLVAAARAGDGKLRPDQRLVVHAALMKATNHTKVHLMENRLVLAYRQFEETSVLTPHKADRSVSQVDARKVRWLFVYAMHQVLRSCADVPREVKFTERVEYHLGVSTKGLPPWEGRGQSVTHPSLRSVSDSAAVNKVKPPMAFAARGRSISAIPLATSFVLPPVKTPLLNTYSTEIQPDIDYFALTHRDESPSSGRGHGRHDDTHHNYMQVRFDKFDKQLCVSAIKWDSTLPDIAGSPEAPATVLADITAQQQQQQQPSPPQYDSLTFPIRRHRTRKSIRAMYSSDDMLASTPKAEPPPPLPRRSSKRFRKPSGGPSKRWSLAEVVSSLRERSSAANSDAEDSDDAWGLAPSPLRITKTIRRPGTSSSRQVVAATKNNDGGGDGEGDDDVFSEQRRDSSDEWEKSVVHSPVDGDVSPPWAWEQFADLGGLQDVSGLK
ncbi:hypothetical protein SLS63_004832 [Diaporthe eres]|uniref:DUF8004 domain-containing protein n=1 Tax=Diaporthe eres TaxID=83184 RepID=A0ABR1PCM8_DIAER